MATASHESKAIKQLIRDGVIPPECRKFQLTADANGIVRVSFEVFASEETIQKIADAYADNPEEVALLAKRATFTTRDLLRSVSADYE
jgi:hypothetical protein